MLSDTPATIAISFVPSAVVTFPAISGGNSECICRGSLFNLIFHSSFMSLTLDLFRIVSLRCHAVRCGSPPSVSQSAFFCCALGVTIQTIAAPSATRPASNRRVIGCNSSWAVFLSEPQARGSGIRSRRLSFAVQKEIEWSGDENARRHERSGAEREHVVSILRNARLAVHVIEQ